MNIFFLDENPIIAASYHCDQHLHKMILESAQLLSTVGIDFIPPSLRKHLYKPTHINHPCTDWLRKSPHNIHYVISLATELDNIRQSLGADTHKSMEVISFISEFIPSHNSSQEIKESDAIFCGPAFIKFDKRIPTIPLKYQAPYRFKAKRWALDGKPHMSYKGRSTPEFMFTPLYVMDDTNE